MLVLFIWLYALSYWLSENAILIKYLKKLLQYISFFKNKTDYPILITVIEI